MCVCVCVPVCVYVCVRMCMCEYMRARVLTCDICVVLPEPVSPITTTVGLAFTASVIEAA